MNTEIINKKLKRSIKHTVIVFSFSTFGSTQPIFTSDGVANTKAM